MKKIVAVTFLILLVASLLACLYFNKPNNDNNNNNEVAKGTTTLLRIKNSNPDTVLVYLTLSGGKGWVSDVNGIFGIVSTYNNLQGSFMLAPNDSLDYTTPDSLGLSGNISFGYAPVNCPVGITVYEFTLNNAGTVKYAQETAEISCVAGVNSLGKITLYEGGGKWEANPNYMDVREIHNDSIGKNSGLVGVFPYGCTNCTDTAGKPDCVTNPEKPQSQSICNISRDANKSGGAVKDLCC